MSYRYRHSFALALGFQVVITLILTPIALGEDEDIKTLYLPKSFKAEGKITLLYESDNETIEHHFAFDEIVSSKSERSKVNIGPVFHDQVTYQYISGQILKINEQGFCDSYQRRSDQNFILIPEIDWFARLTYTDEELRENVRRLAPKFGPSLMIIMPMYSKIQKPRVERTEKYRNVDCKVSVSEYSRRKASGIRLEVFSPPIDLVGSSKVPFFSVRESAIGVRGGQGETFNASFMLDYYNVERISDNDTIELQGLEEEFNLPFGVGCSQFLTALPQPEIDGKSFIMTFQQYLAQSFVTFAYDSERAYLRREMFPKGIVSIWDLDEELLYSIDNYATTSMMIDMHSANDQPTDIQSLTSAEVCSVLNIKDPTLGAGQRPQGKLYDGGIVNLSVVKFLGAESLSYIGRATVRDLPCAVYESIINEPPPIFGLSEKATDRNKTDYDYIIQFYLLRTTTMLDNYNAIGREFWPARISLIKRHRPSGLLQKLHDSIEISDFHWGLTGLDNKPSELFSAPDCFDVDEEQVRIELLIGFQRNGVNLTSGTAMVELRENKFVLEMHVLDYITGLFNISRLHVTEYELTLRPDDAIARLVISDRKFDRTLTYFGGGDLPEEPSSSHDRLLLTGDLDEQSCVTVASHITDISLVAYCPLVPGYRPEAQCIAVIDEMTPVISLPDKDSGSMNPFESNDHVCHIYKFSAAAPPVSATSDWSNWHDKLIDHKFTFAIENGDKIPSAIYVSEIRSVVVEKTRTPVVVANYRYSLSDGNESIKSKDAEISEALERQEHPPKVRSFPMMTYTTVGDCERMCNLDVNCRSYSYCSLPRATNEDNLGDEKCLLSSLDIRASDVNKQLVYQRIGDEVKVKDSYTDGTGEYTLKLQNGCMLHEKDYLESFTDTGETMTILRDDAASYMPASSATECAKVALELEGKQEKEQSLTMAFCADLQVCLIETNLFTPVAENAKAGGGLIEDDEKQQGYDENKYSYCNVYHRRYQTFFHVSPKVFKLAKIGDDQTPEDFRQQPLELATVEECAHACWIEFGHVCASFDHCSNEQLCLINSIALDKPLEVDGKTAKASQSAKDRLEDFIEKRADCLHYERDLRIDQIRKSHANLRHKVLDMSLALNKSKETSSSWTFGGVLLNLLIFCAISASFLGGIVLGQGVSERLEQRPTILPGSNGIANFINSLASLHKDGASDTRALDDEIQDGTQMHAIQMEEINTRGQGQDAGADELIDYSHDA